MKTVFLRIGEDADSNVSWIGSDTDKPSAGTLADAAEFCNNAETIVIVPSTDVLLISADVPVQNQRKAIQAAPYVLEEQLAEDVEDLHFAYAHVNKEGRINTAVVSKKRLGRWVEILRQAGIEPSCLVPETLAVPYLPNTLSILVEKDLACFRSGRQAGYAADKQNLHLVLQNQLQPVNQSDDKFSQFQIYIEENSYLPENVELPEGTKITKIDPLLLMAREFNKNNIINLLQGKYRKQNDWERILQQWKYPLAMALVLVFLKMTLFGVDFVQLKNESLALKRQAENIYLSTFPEAKQVVDPKKQMEQHLARLSLKDDGVNDLLGLLSLTGANLQKTNDYKLQKLSYHKNTLHLDMTMSSLELLDKLKNNLQANKALRVEIRSASSDKDNVSARIDITGSNK